MCCSFPGVGNARPDIDYQTLDPQKEQHLLPSSTLEDMEQQISPLLMGEPAHTPSTMCTPQRPAKALRPSMFYKGLDSSAGAKLLMSPAIVRAPKITSALLTHDFLKVSSGDCNGEARHTLTVFL